MKISNGFITNSSSTFFTINAYVPKEYLMNLIGMGVAAGILSPALAEAYKYYVNIDKGFSVERGSFDVHLLRQFEDDINNIHKYHSKNEEYKNQTRVVEAHEYDEDYWDY